MNLQKKVEREDIVELESTIKSLTNSLGEDPFPLEHFYAKGMYCRQLTIPKGYFVVGKIHKYSHFVFYLSGDVSVVSEFGRERISKPCIRVSPEGAKRAFYAHEETVMLTVHATEETELESIENEIIAKDFEELAISHEIIEQIGEL